MTTLLYSTHARVRHALDRLSRHEPAQLPPVLTSRDVVPLLGRAWFHELLARHALPGVQPAHCGVWRCDRETFVLWLREVCDGA